MQTIAEEQKVDRSYARRVIYLAFLDPEIVKRILDGDHPGGVECHPLASNDTIADGVDRTEDVASDDYLTKSVSN